MREMALVAWMSRSWSVRVSTDSRAATKPASPKPLRTTADGRQTTHNSTQEQKTQPGWRNWSPTGETVIRSVGSTCCGSVRSLQARTEPQHDQWLMCELMTDQYVSVGTTYTLWRVRPPVLRSAGSEVLGAAETEPEPAESRWSPPAQQHLYLETSRTTCEKVPP